MQVSRVTKPALFITRWLLNAFYALGADTAGLYGVKQPVEKPYDFVGKSRVFYGISLALILLGFVLMGVNKAGTGDILNYGLDFKGGTSTNVKIGRASCRERV